MQSFGRAMRHGLVVWLVPFGVAFLIFPLREANRPLFESIMPVAVAAIVTVLAVAYVRRLDRPTMRDGLTLGVLWMAMSVAIDAPLMLLGGPMQMTIGAYLADIGVTYLMIPVITTGIAVVRAPAPLPAGHADS